MRQSLNNLGKLVAFEDALDKHLWHLQIADWLQKVQREYVCSDGSSLGASRLALTLVLSSAQDYQALELIFLGQAALDTALDALEALALMTSRTTGTDQPGSCTRAHQCAGRQVLG